MSSDDLRNESKVTSFLSRKKDRKKAATKITSKMEQANVIVTIHLKRFIHPQQGVDFPQRRLLTPFLANVTLELLAHLRGKYRQPFIVAAAVQPAVRRIAVVVCSRPSIRQTELEKTLTDLTTGLMIPLVAGNCTGDAARAPPPLRSYSEVQQLRLLTVALTFVQLIDCVQKEKGFGRRGPWRSLATRSPRTSHQWVIRSLPLVFWHFRL